jgi:hypothetical protein
VKGAIVAPVGVGLRWFTNPLIFPKIVSSKKQHKISPVTAGSITGVFAPACRYLGSLKTVVLLVISEMYMMLQENHFLRCVVHA